MVECGIDEDTGVVPSAGLDTDGLMNESMLREILVRDGNGCRSSGPRNVDGRQPERTVFAKESDERAISAPDNVLHRGRGDLRERLLLLDVVQDDGGSRAKDKARGSAVEYLVGLNGGLNALHDGVRQVADLDELYEVFIQSGCAQGGTLVDSPASTCSARRTCSSQRR